MRRDPRIAFAAALTGAGLLPLVWFAAFHVPALRRADLSVLSGFFDLYHGRLATLADIIPHYADPQPFTLIGLALVGVALLRRRGRVALAAAVILLGANITTQVLKQIAAHPRAAGDIGISTNAWPSGHATASMSLALGAVLVSSLRWRPLVAAFGAVGTLAVTFLLLVAGWHFPSDVIGGYLVAGTWTAAVVGVLWALDPTPSRPSAPGAPLRFGEAIAPLGAVVVGLLAMGVLAAVARPEAVTEYARAHTVFVVGASVLALIVLCLAALMSAALTVSGSGPAPRGAPRRDSPRARG